MNDPWDRQANEPAASFDAFCRYLARGPTRKIVDLSREDDHNYGQTANEWRWRARAEAWDRRVSGVRTEAVLDEVAEMSRRHASLAMEFVDGYLAPELAKLMAKAKDSDRPAIRAPEWSRALETAVKVERLSRGEATENVVRRVVGAMDLSRLSPDEQAEVERLLAKAAGDTEPGPAR